MIVKRGDQWCLLTKDGKRTLGCYDTKQEAEDQEKAIKSNVTRTARYLYLRGAMNGETRSEMFNDVEHLVVPIVALVEGVIWPVNAESPELVLAEEFSEAPLGWNGRPVVNDHPMLDGHYVSANIPQILESEQLGLIFNTVAAKKKLQMEAWLNTARAEMLGEKGLRILERASKGDDIEISVGVFVTPEESDGKYNGVAYKTIWRDIIPDHLALLSEGEIGACSIDMGCGAPRSARLHVLSANQETYSIEERTMPELKPAAPDKNKKKVSWLSRLRELATDVKSPPIRVGGATFDMSDSDLQLRQDLEIELRAKVPGYMYVEGVSLADHLVLFSAMPRDEWKYFTHEFTVRNEIVKLKGEPVEVEPVTRFEPINEEVQPTTATTAPCSCQKEQKMAVKNQAERVQALIDSKKNGLAAASKSVLESMTEEQLKALEDADVALPEPKKVEEPTKVEEPKKVEEPVAATTTKPPTEDEWMKIAPESIRTMVSDYKAASSTRRNALVTKIKDAQSQFSEDDLKAMPLDQLEKVGALLRVENATVDYSGFGLPRTIEKSGDSPDDPPSLRDAVMARREQQK